MKESTQNLFQFIENSPCSYLAICEIKRELNKHGFEELQEQDSWNLQTGGKYYVVRNNSSVIAFVMPERDFKGFHIVASHCDAPAFKIKENPEFTTEKYMKLNVEKYGGMIMSTWMDRCLSVAGRVFVKTACGVQKYFVHVKRDLLLIPNLAIHMNRDMNKGVEYSVQKDMCPILSTELSKQNMKQIVAEVLNEQETKEENLGKEGKQGKTESKITPEDIISMDLFLYNRDQAKVFGAEEEFIAAPRLDDLQCVYASLQALLACCGAKDGVNSANIEGTSEALDYCPVMAVFDNEEVGSSSMQGADSTFLPDVLIRMKESLELSESEYRKKLAGSFLLSADNAHGVHPNHPEKADPTNKPVLNGGVVLKSQANQRYTTDAASSAYVKQLCEKNNIPYQTYANHSDIVGGSTLGNIAITHLSIPAADIGNAQLAMHSAYETAGEKDLEYMMAFMKAFYSE